MLLRLPEARSDGVPVPGCTACVRVARAEGGGGGTVVEVIPTLRTACGVV